MKQLTYLLILVFTLISSVVSAQIGIQKPLLKGVFYQYYEKSMSAWQGMDSVAFAYDSLGRKVEAVQYFGDNKPLFQSDKKAYIYDSLGRIHIEQIYLWDSNQAVWKLSGRSTNSYNISDSLLSIVTEDFDSVAWRFNSKWEYTFDANGNKTTEQLFFWDTIQNNWTSAKGQKTTRSFDGNNRILSENHYIWDYTNNVLRPSSQRFFTYSGTIKSPSLILGQMWDGVSSWHNSVKDSIIFDSKGLKIESFGFYFNESTNSSWEKTFRNLYSYSVDGKLIETKLDYFDPKKMQFTLGDQSRVWNFKYTSGNDLNAILGGWYDTVQKSYLPYEETMLYYQGIQTLQLSPNDWMEECDLFPNPFNQHIRLKCDDLDDSFEITFYTIEGEILKQEIVQSSNEIIDIDTRNLKNGVYFIRLLSEEGKQKMTKMIKL